MADTCSQTHAGHRQSKMTGFRITDIVNFGCVCACILQGKKETETAGYKHMHRNVGRGYLAFTLQWQSVWEKSKEGEIESKTEVNKKQ